MNATTGIGLVIVVGALTLGLVFGEDLPEDPIPVDGHSIVDDADPIGAYEQVPEEAPPVTCPAHEERSRSR